MEGLRIMAVPPLWQEDSKKQIWGQEVDHKDEGRIKGRCTLCTDFWGLFAVIQRKSDHV